MSAVPVLELHDGAHVGILQTDQVRLSVPPNAVVDSLGQPVTGPVDVSIVPLDPTSWLASAPSQRPGGRGVYPLIV